MRIKGKNRWYGLNFPRQLALWSHWPVQTITISGSSFRVVTELRNSTLLEKSFTSTPTARDWSLANCLSFTRSRLYILCFLPHQLLHILQTTTFCVCLDRCQFWKSVNHGGCQRKRMTIIRQGILFFVLYMVRVRDLSHPYAFLSLPWAWYQFCRKGRWVFQNGGKGWAWKL